MDWPQASEYENEARPRMRRESPNAVLVLILGILGILVCCCGFFGVIAFILGALEREKVSQGIYEPSGILTAGWVLGIIGVALFLIWVMGAYLLLVFSILYWFS